MTAITLARGNRRVVIDLTRRRLIETRPDGERVTAFEDFDYVTPDMVEALYRRQGYEDVAPERPAAKVGRPRLQLDRCTADGCDQPRKWRADGKPLRFCETHMREYERARWHRRQGVRG